MYGFGMKMFDKFYTFETLKKNNNNKNLKYSSK